MKDISAFEFLKDAKDLPHFLKGLSRSNLLAINIVFKYVVDNCGEYKETSDSKLMAKLNIAIADGNILWLIEEQEVNAAINWIAFSDDMNKNSMRYLLESGFACSKRRDMCNLVNRIKNLIKAADAESWILPHLKLALAYNPGTNGT